MTQNTQQVQIKAENADFKGAYANMVQIAHTPEEFVLDFLSIFPPQGSLVSRVILSPSHTKRMSQALQENIAKYEKEFGVISLAVVPDSKIGFRTE